MHENIRYSNIRLTIFGAGRWGMNHVKTAATLLPHENITVVDVNPSSGEKVKTVSEKINFTTDFDQSFTNQEPRTKNEELVIIATPAETHFEIAKKCLESGKHVLVEKPITLTASEAEQLLNLSLSKRSGDPAVAGNLNLMVGHVLLFHPAVTKMKEEIIDGKIGRLQYIYSNRLNLGAIRSEENSLWSFAPHDISIIQYLITSYMQSINHSSMQDDSVFPYSINAFGASHVQPGIEDSTLTYLKYANDINAHIFVSWLHPFKEQRMVVIGDKGMFVFEDSAKTEKLKFYKKGFQSVNGNIEKFDSDYEVVDFENKMPLTEEHKHFYDSVLNNTTPLTDGRHAFEVLKILEQATNSLKGSK